MTTVNSPGTISSAGTYELNLGSGDVQIGVATANGQNPSFNVTVDAMAAAANGGTLTIGNADVVIQQLASAPITIYDGFAGNTGNGFVLGGAGTIELAATATVVPGDVVTWDDSTLQIDNFAGGQLNNLTIGGLYQDKRDALVLTGTHGVTLKSDGNIGAGTRFEVDNALGASLGTFTISKTNVPVSLLTISYDAAPTPRSSTAISASSRNHDRGARQVRRPSKASQSATSCGRLRAGSGRSSGSEAALIAWAKRRVPTC